MDNRSMFYGATPHTFSNARSLRNSETEAEKILWEKLRKNQLDGFRFKRQHPVASYIADFYCHKVKLVIELDGAYHQDDTQKRYDVDRSNLMNELGLKVIRFTNQEIFNNLDGVLEQIRKHLPS